MFLLLVTIVYQIGRHSGWVYKIVLILDKKSNQGWGEGGCPGVMSSELNRVVVGSGWVIGGGMVRVG